MYSPPRRDPDFDWLSDDSVILEPRQALAIYVNQRGEVVLRQQAAWDQDDDSFVVFPFQDAERVAACIIDLVRNPADFRNAPRRCALSEGNSAEQPAGDTPELDSRPNGGAAS
jgi:hypothetical protein